MRLQVIPTENQLNERLDVILAKGLNLPRAQVQKAIAEGCVTVGGQWIRRSAFKLKSLMPIQMEWAPAVVEGLVAQHIPLDILYEDDAVLIVNKPTGMVVHPGAGRETATLVHALLAHCPNLPEGTEPNKPGIVHRLDKATSGVMVVAKTAESMQALLQQFKERRVEKIYQTWVMGKMMGQGLIDRAIGRHVSRRQKMSSHTQKGRRALTEWEAVEQSSDRTRLQIKLHTGRTHQIRVHLAEAGHPVLGDTVYGKKTGAPLFPRLALHAWKLGFYHPVTGEWTMFEAPLPKDFLK